MILPPPPSEKLFCAKCKIELRKGQYRRIRDSDLVAPERGAVVCHGRKAEAYCRQRTLGEELGIELFTRYPRESTYFEMDPRPADANKSWRPISTDDDRVMAAWIYYSWCYPVGLAYAVQVDEDDDLMKDRGMLVLMTHERLAKILGMPRQSVTRSTARLVARKRLRVDDGRTYPVAKPQISLAEREAANEANDKELGEAPNTIPRKYRHLLNDLLGDVEDKSIRTDALDEVIGFCTQYNEDHQRIRTARDFGIEQVCTRIASLLSRPLIFRASSSPDSIQAPESTAREASGSNTDDDASSSKELYAGHTGDPAEGELREALYAAGAGKGKMAKLPAKEDRAPMLIQSSMRKWLGSHLVDLVIPTAIWVQASALNWSALEVCCLVDDRGPYAEKKRNPAKFLEVAVSNHLKTPGMLDEIRARMTAADREAARDRQREEERAGARSVAEAQDAAFNERWEAMPAEERESRIRTALKRLAAEAKAAGGKQKAKWDMGLTAKMKRTQAEVAAAHEFRREIESEASASGTGSGDAP